MIYMPLKPSVMKEARNYETISVSVVTGLELGYINKSAGSSEAIRLNCFVVVLVYSLFSGGIRFSGGMLQRQGVQPHWLQTPP